MCYEKKGICERCGKYDQLQLHHRFSQTKLNKRLYGLLIHDQRNLQKICYQCHHNEPLEKWTEEEFCEVLGIEPRSKAYFMRIMRTHDDG
jgi:rRNA maturation endonuclease Nob1